MGGDLGISQSVDIGRPLPLPHTDRSILKGFHRCLWRRKISFPILWGTLGGGWFLECIASVCISSRDCSCLSFFHSVNLSLQSGFAPPFPWAGTFLGPWVFPKLWVSGSVISSPPPPGRITSGLHLSVF